MLVAPNDQTHPLRNVPGIEGLVHGGARPKALLVSVLVHHKKTEAIVGPALRQLEFHFFLLKHLVQNRVLYVAQTIEGDFGRRAMLADDERPNDDVLQIRVLSEVVDVVAGLQQIARGNSAEITRGVVVVAVDRENGKGDVERGVFHIRAVGLSVHGDVEGRTVAVLPAEHVLLHYLQAVEKALLAGVHLVEEVAAQQQKIHFLGPRVRKHLLERLERILVSHRVLLLVAEVDVGRHQKSYARLHSRTKYIIITLVCRSI